jgi:Skp family chaperone for outer membrane proteins
MGASNVLEHVGKHTRPNDEAVKAETSSALIEKIVEPSLSSRVPHGARQLFLLAGQVFRKALQIISKPVRMVGGKVLGLKVTESKSRHESPPPVRGVPRKIIQDGGIEFSTSAVSPSYEDSLSDDLSVQPKSARSWRLAPWGRVAVFSTILFFVALLVNIWFYAGRQTQHDKLSLAYANIQTVYSDFIKADRQVKVLRSELAGSKAEIRRIQNELDDSRMELQGVRNQLAEARQNLESIQRRNAQGMDRLHEQIQKLTVWVKESNKNSQPSSGSSTSGQ